MNKLFKKINQFAVLADFVREQSEEINDIWVKEFERSDEMMHFAELEKNGKKLDTALSYRDYLWQVKQLLIQAQSLSSDAIVNAEGDFVNI